MNRLKIKKEIKGETKNKNLIAAPAREAGFPVRAVRIHRSEISFFYQV